MTAANRSFLDSYANADKLLNGQVSIVDHPVHGFPCLKLETGRYAGVIVGFGEVKFSDDAKQIRLSFQYQIVGDESNEVDPAFRDYVGEILVYLFVCAMSTPAEMAASDWANFRLE